jgi:hypothetical protein
MNITISQHVRERAQLRQLQSYLDVGLDKLRDLTLDSGISGEVNFIASKLPQAINREGSSGDLVIIGCQVVSSDRLVVKSIFLQHSWQVANRIRKLGKQYAKL